MGTPIEINWEYVAELLQAGCSGVQVAARIGVHENTLYLRCKSDLGVEFVAFKAENRASGEALLLEKQFEVATKDRDKAMLIWLGKQRLDQKDKSEHDHKNDGGKFNQIEVVFKDFSKKDEDG
jgi:hypothetical protein